MESPSYVVSLVSHHWAIPSTATSRKSLLHGRRETTCLVSPAPSLVSLKNMHGNKRIKLSEIVVALQSDKKFMQLWIHSLFAYKVKGSSCQFSAPVRTNMSSSVDKSCEFLCALAATDGSSSGDRHSGSSNDEVRDSTLWLWVRFRIDDFTAV